MNSASGKSKAPVLNEEPLTLPPWFKPDPRAGDKGKLLYIEEWGGKKVRLK